MLASLLEDNLRDFPTRALAARLARGDVVLLASDRDMAVTLSFRSDEIVVDEGALTGVATLAGAWLDLARLCSGQRSAFASMRSGDLRITPGRGMRAAAGAGLALSVPRSFYDEDQGRGRRRRTLMALAVLGTVLLVGVELGGVAVSHDRGATWEARNGGLFDDVHVVLADGPLLYATTGMGCFVSLDEGWRWSWASDGIDRGYTLGLAWTDDAVVVSAASGPPSLWEAGGPEAAIYRSSSRGREPRWERVFDAFGGAVERNCLQARDALVVAGTTDGELLISRDAGRTFSVGRSDLPAVNAVALAG